MNKVNTKVTLRWDIRHSKRINGPEKKYLIKRLGNRVNKQGVMLISSQGSRSQIINKQHVLTLLEQLLNLAATRPKHRRPTSPTKTSIINRLKSKKQLSMKKQRRGEGRHLKDNGFD